MLKKLSGILLAGGKSSRMGKDKSFLEYQGKKLYEFPLKILQEFCDEIIISANHDGFNKLGYPVISDEITDIGPMGGIYSCLQNITNDNALIISCDVPFVKSEYVETIISESVNCSVCMGMDSSGFPQALISVFNKSIINYLKGEIISGNFKMRDVLAHKDSKLIDLRSSFKDLDDNFININSPEDFKKLFEE